MRPADSFVDRTADLSGHVISDERLALFPEGSLPWLIYFMNSADKTKFVVLDIIVVIIVCSVVPGGRVPQQRCASQFFIRFLTNGSELLTWETKCWLG